MISLVHINLTDIIVVAVITLFALVLLWLLVLTALEKIQRRVKRFFGRVGSPNDKGIT